MPSLDDLTRWRGDLFSARMDGVRRVRDANGEEVEYRSDREMAAAIAACDREIAAMSGRAANVIRFQNIKGSDMKNYQQRGETVTIPSPASVASGELVVVGALYGVAAGDAETGAALDLVTLGVFELPKVSALAINIGDKVYFDSATKLVNKTAGGNAYIGVAISPAVNPSGTVAIRLNGAF